MYVFSASIMLYFFTPNILQAELIKHIGKVKLFSTPSKLKIAKVYDAGIQIESSEKKLLSEIISEVSMRGTLHLNAWLVVVA
jgi:hypothetical protein